MYIHVYININTHVYTYNLEKKASQHITNACGAFLLLAVRTGIEPVFPPWEGGVLTAWPTNRSLYYHGQEDIASIFYNFYLVPKIFVDKKHRKIIQDCTIYIEFYMCLGNNKDKNGSV